MYLKVYVFDFVLFWQVAQFIDSKNLIINFYTDPKKTVYQSYW